jgi:hypothetical protein
MRALGLRKLAVVPALRGVSHKGRALGMGAVVALGIGGTLALTAAPAFATVFTGSFTPSVATPTIAPGSTGTVTVVATASATTTLTGGDGLVNWDVIVPTNATIPSNACATTTWLYTPNSLLATFSGTDPDGCTVLSPTEISFSANPASSPGSTITVTIPVSVASSVTAGTPLTGGTATLSGGTQNSSTLQMSPSGPTTSFTIATSAQPIINGPASGSTTTTTPTITGTGSAGDPVTVTDQNGNVVCTTTVAADGAFSCTPTNPLAVGSDTLTATLTNPNGSTTAGTPDAITVVAASGSPMANPEVAGGLGVGVLAFGGIELVRRRRRAARRTAA